MTGFPGDGFRVRSLAATVYAPNFLFAIGQGAATPMIALLALDLGGSAAVAGTIVAARGFGMMIFDIPAGMLVARLGDRRAMSVASALLAGVVAVISLRPPLLVYAGLIVLMGCAWSMWMLARVAYATEASPADHRGRVMSTMGGVTRAGHFIGPVLGGLLVIPMGLTGPFVLQAVLAAAASVTLYVIDAPGSEGSAPEPADLRSPLRIFREHRRTFSRTGVVLIALMVMRASRQAIIPLWGDSIGVGASQISLIFGGSMAMEILMFYPVGMLMDRRGRKWTLVPCMFFLAVGIMAIPLSSDLISLVIVGLGIGLANGLGSGINMTLSSDLSPDVGRSQFLGIWRFVTDVGTTGGPLVVAVVTSVASLAFSAVTVGAVGLIGLAVLIRAVPETMPKGAGPP